MSNHNCLPTKKWAFFYPRQFSKKKQCLFYEILSQFYYAIWYTIDGFERIKEAMCARIIFGPLTPLRGKLIIVKNSLPPLNGCFNSNFINRTKIWRGGGESNCLNYNIVSVKRRCSETQNNTLWNVQGFPVFSKDARLIFNNMKNTKTSLYIFV